MIAIVPVVAVSAIVATVVGYAYLANQIDVQFEKDMIKMLANLKMRIQKLEDTDPDSIHVSSKSNINEQEIEEEHIHETQNMLDQLKLRELHTKADKKMEQTLIKLFSEFVSLKYQERRFFKKKVTQLYNKIDSLKSEILKMKTENENSKSDNTEYHDAQTDTNRQIEKDSTSLVEQLAAWDKALENEEKAKDIIIEQKQKYNSKIKEYEQLYKQISEEYLVKVERWKQLKHEKENIISEINKNLHLLENLKKNKNSKKHNSDLPKPEPISTAKAKL